MGVSGRDVGDSVSLLELLPELVVVDGQSGDVRGGQVAVLTKLAVVAPQLGIAGNDSGVLGCGGRIGALDGWCPPDFAEFLDDLWVVAAEGGVGQPKVPGQCQDAGPMPVGNNGGAEGFGNSAGK